MPENPGFCRELFGTVLRLPRLLRACNKKTKDFAVHPRMEPVRRHKSTLHPPDPGGVTVDLIDRIPFQIVYLADPWESESRIE